MKTVRISDRWVRKQLTECFTLQQKLKYELKYILKYLMEITGRSGFSIPPVSMAMSIKLIAGFVGKEIEEERTFISHHKILESQNLGSAANDLRNILDHLPDFQAYIYATDEFFRDHIEHQIRVAVLGDFLLSQSFDSLEGPARLVDTVGSILRLEERDVRNAWWIAGLFHDIGIPLQKLPRNFNKIIKDDLASVFKNLDLSVPEINDPIPDENSNKVLFEKLAGNLIPAIKDNIKNASGWGCTREIDHGVASALLLLKSIPKVSDSNTDTMNDLFENEYKHYLVGARAMMLHNLYQNGNCVEISSDRDPLAYLLVLCDEMQEWGRQVNIKERELLDMKFERDQLVKQCLLSMSDDEVILSFEYKNQRAKDKCRFAFDYYFADKKKNMMRLKNDKHIFPRAFIKATDFVFDQNELIRTNHLEISTSQ